MWIKANELVENYISIDMLTALSGIRFWYTEDGMDKPTVIQMLVHGENGPAWFMYDLNDGRYDTTKIHKFNDKSMLHTFAAPE